MSDLYSNQLAIGTVPGGSPQLVYTVPTGYVAVILDMELSDQNSANDLLFITLGPSASPATLGFLDPGSGASNQWHGRIVLNPGDQIVLAPETDAWAYILSGWLLAQS